jgi:hypothetical protein
MSPLTEEQIAFLRTLAKEPIDMRSLSRAQIEHDVSGGKVSDLLMRGLAEFIRSTNSHDDYTSGNVPATGLRITEQGIRYLDANPVSDD